MANLAILNFEVLTDILNLDPTSAVCESCKTKAMFARQRLHDAVI